MKAEKLIYLSHNREHQISAWLIYDESREVKGVVQIAHGMREYFLRYRELARFLTQAGYAVCGNDHIGHGDSCLHRPGYMGVGDIICHMAYDMHALFERIKLKFPNCPYFLLGHSMGSFASRIYASKWAYELDGLLLSGTGELSAIEKISFRVLACFCHGITAVLGMDMRANLVEKLLLCGYLRNFRPIKTNADWQTSDTIKARTFMEDPKSSFRFPYAAYESLARSMVKVSGKQWAKSLPKSFPTLVFSGEKDPIGSDGLGVRRLYANLKNAGAQDVTLLIYPGGRHEMLNETNRAEVFEDILNWLNEKTQWASSVQP